MATRKHVKENDTHVLPSPFPCLGCTRAAQIIREIRRQFRDIPGLREKKPGVKCDPARCVDISTRAALKEMFLPGIMAILAPPAFGYLGSKEVGVFLAWVHVFSCFAPMFSTLFFSLSLPPSSFLLLRWWPAC